MDQNINIMRNRIKVHPIGYVAQHNKRKKVQCNGNQCTHIQKIKMVNTYDVPVYDKNHKEIGTIRCQNVQMKTIYHTDFFFFFLRTLAQIYWDSVLNSGNYEAYQNKFRKREKSLND